MIDYERDEHMSAIRSELRMDAAGKIRIGYHLLMIKNQKDFYDFRRFEDFVREHLGITKPTAHRYINLCNAFSLKKDGKPTDEIDPKYKDMRIDDLIRLLREKNGNAPKKKNAPMSVNNVISEFSNWAELKMFDTSSCEELKPGQIIRLVISTQ